MLGAVFQKSKTPSYPPVRGRLDSFSACVSSFHSFLRFFLSFIPFCLSSFLPSFLKGGLCIQPPPHRGIRGGLCGLLLISYQR